jgi:hypothetical protein
MTTVAQAQKNGKGVQGAQEPKAGEQSLVKQTPQAETLELKLKENSPMTVEETIKRVNELQDNIDKREVLKNHLHAVSSLKFGEFDDKDQLMLISHTGEKYPIKSSGLCLKCAELIKREIQEHIEEVEQFIVL